MTASDPTPASGKHDSDYRIIDGIEYVKVSRVKMFIAIANQQAVQKALEGLLEHKIEVREPFFDSKMYVAGAVVPVSVIQAALAAAQVPKEIVKNPDGSPIFGGGHYRQGNSYVHFNGDSCQPRKDGDERGAE